MLENASERGYAVFHVALNPDGSLQPIINVPLSWSNQELIAQLLSTTSVGIDEVKSPTGEQYLFAFDGKAPKPFPSVMIFKFRFEGSDRLFMDMTQDDYPAIEFAVENYLR